MGLYAVDGGVLGAVSGAVLGVAGEGSRRLAGGEPNKQQDKTAAGIRYFANFIAGVLFSAGEFGCEPPLLLCG